MLLVATISSTHSTWRVGLSLRRTGLRLAEKCLSLSSRTASVQIPSSRLIFLVMCSRSSSNDFANRAGVTPRSTARRIMKCSWMVDNRLIRLL